MNPFTPTFGSSPPVLVGRDEDLEDFRVGLESGPGAPERATLLTGLRGTGKTVMLNAYEGEAGLLGWLTIAETATPGLLERLETDHLPRLLAEHDPRGAASTITGVTASGFGLQREVQDRRPVSRPGLRTMLAELCDVLGSRGSGLLITLDEVHAARMEDLKEIGAVVQHLIREDRAVALVCAGLPSAVSDLLNEKVLTFLRRADRRHLRTVSPEDVARGLRVPIEGAGRRIEADALETAVAGTGGYPYLIQLVGLHTWRSAGRASTITNEHAVEGVRQARRKIGQLVHAPALGDLSDVDRSFLVAMSVDQGRSRMGDIAERLGVSPVYAGQYRLRLLQAEMIEPAGYGHVRYTLPGLRAYLRDHAASSQWQDHDD